MRLIDISRALRTGGAHWPGDTPTRFQLISRLAANESCNVGQLSLSVHNGTHADAPFHFDDQAATIDALPLDAFIGPARVIDARGQASLSESLFTEFNAETMRTTPRILLRTDAWLDPAVFPARWPSIAPTLPAWLASHGVRLLGLDVPSVDPLESRDLPIHHALGRAGILILESLDLTDAAPGAYELIALPLKIHGADGAPVRAVLRANGSSVAAP
jgi:arylformamidase